MSIESQHNHARSTRRRGTFVLGTFVDSLSWEEALDRLTAWAASRESRYICICNVHSVVTASRDAGFSRILNQSDLTTPDGMPVAWALRWLGFHRQQRINGPDLMWRYLAEAEKQGQIVFFYGSTDRTLAKLHENILKSFPSIRIGGMLAPPFTATPQIDADAIAAINASGASTVFVGLGCPKQEQWMALHRGRVQAVIVGVGAAFDYHAGTLKRAPIWMQHHGLEWLYRLVTEPRRLWKRYLVTNALFLCGIFRQIVLKQPR